VIIAGELGERKQTYFAGTPAASLTRVSIDATICSDPHPQRAAMTARLLTAAAVAMLIVAPATPRMLPAQSATPRATESRIATDPDVLGAERLFSAWLEGQITYRGLPGIAVGVVSDQELVWSSGFGFADLKAKTAMTPATKFRMASHSKLFT